MFSVGEKVYYPMHGVGVIKAIEEKEVLGSVASYYIMQFAQGRMTNMVPVASAQMVGLRPLVPPEEYERVLTHMLASPTDDNDNWNKRYHSNLEKLRSGNIYSVAEVVRALMAREDERGLSAKEKKMLVNARTLLVDELAEVSGRPQSEIEETINNTKGE